MLAALPGTALTSTQAGAVPNVVPAGVTLPTFQALPISPVTPANAIVRSGIPSSAEYVVDPIHRSDNIVHTECTESSMLFPP